MRIIKCFFFLLITSDANSQNIAFSGKVIDKITKSAIVGATVKIEKNGFITNNKGYFSVSYGKNAIEKSGLTISCIGYNALQISFESNNTFLVIELESSSYTLPPVVLLTGARNIIKKAIERIPNNYPNNSFLIKGYQKTFEQINDSDYFFKDEALLNIYNPAYGNRKKTANISVLQNKRLEIFNIDTVDIKNKKALRNWVGGYLFFKKIDFILNKFSFVNEKNIDEYNYILTGQTIRDQYNVFVIDFFTKENIRGFEGTLFIDVESYAIVGAIFSRNQGLKESTQKSVYKESFSVFEVNFSQTNLKWYFQDYHVEQMFFRGEANQQNNVYSFFADFITLSIDTVNVTKFFKADQVGEKQRAIDIIKNGNEANWNFVADLSVTDRYKERLKDLKVPKQLEIIHSTKK